MTVSWKNKLILLAATGFGLGYSPVAPGTLGTLAALPFIWLFTCMPETGGAFFLVCFVLVAVFVADKAEIILLRKDPSTIVIDEMVGYCVTMCLVPVTGTTLIAGFIAFRCFDIVKIGPVRYFEESFSGGAGIVLDDIMAGVLAALTVKGLYILGLH